MNESSANATMAERDAILPPHRVVHMATTSAAAANLATV